MTEQAYREHIKRFFEAYYEKLSSMDEMYLCLPGVEEAMWSEDADPNEEWKKWKLIPSTVTKQDLDQLEEEVGVKFPLCLRAFLSVYHHYFQEGIGANPTFEPFDAVLTAWNPVLIQHGYLPFAWDEDGYFIRCIKLEAMPDEEQCGIYQIDHELLPDEEDVSKEEIDSHMEFVAANLLEYLNQML